VRLCVLGGGLQAQLDGFKSRALRGVVQAQRHLYATEWGALEATDSDSCVLFLQGSVIEVISLRNVPPFPWGPTSTLREDIGNPIVAMMLPHMSAATVPLTSLEAALTLVQAQTAYTHSTPRLCLLTVGTHVEDCTGGSRGLARTASTEALLPLQWVCVTKPATTKSCSMLVAEPEVVLRVGMHLVPRLRVAPSTLQGPFRLSFNVRRTGDKLLIEPQPLPVPSQGFDVLLRVRAAALHFSDVLELLGDHASDGRHQLGDTSGMVEETSTDVLHVGQKALFGIVPARFASFACATSVFLARLPLALSFEDACTLPTVWTTIHVACAWYGGRHWLPVGGILALDWIVACSHGRSTAHGHAAVSCRGELVQ
jgi:hypothetical protein